MREFAKHDRRLNLTIVQADVRELVANVNADRPRDQAQEYARLTEQLKAAGADYDCGYKVLDCAEIHMDAIVHKVVGL